MLRLPTRGLNNVDHKVKESAKHRPKEEEAAFDAEVQEWKPKVFDKKRLSLLIGGGRAPL